MQYLLWPLSEQFQNKNGSILTNGKIYVYYRGRTELATTYSDEDGLVENTQPIILDDNGRAACYVNPAYSYTVVVCDFYGRELFSYDESIHSGSGGSGNVEIASSDHSILIDETSIIGGTRYDERVNPEFVEEVALSAVTPLIPHYRNEDRTIVVNDNTKEIKTDMQCVMIRQQINHYSDEYKYAKICEADLRTITWVNEWATALQLSFQSSGAYYKGKSTGLFTLNCENYLTNSYSPEPMHEEDGKWSWFDKDDGSPQIKKLYLYWRDDDTSQHYELWGEFEDLKYYEAVGVVAVLNCSLRNHLTSSLPIDQERNIWRFNSIGVETLTNSLPTNAGTLVGQYDPDDADIKPTEDQGPGAFYATYIYNGPASGNTTFEEVKEAYEVGKAIFVKYRENATDIGDEIYSLVSFLNIPEGQQGYSRFMFQKLEQNTGKTLYLFTTNWGRLSDITFANASSVQNLSYSIADNFWYITIPAPSGTYCTYNYRLWKALETITDNDHWDENQWEEVTVMDEIHSNDNEVVYVEYNVTSPSDVQAAVNSRKTVILNLSNWGYLIPLARSGSSAAIFESLVANGRDPISSGYTGVGAFVICDYQTGWQSPVFFEMPSVNYTMSMINAACTTLHDSLEVDIQTVSSGLDYVSSAIDAVSGRDVFIAKYNSSTFEEISDAIDEGKAVFCTGHPYSSDMLLPIASYNPIRPSLVIFSGINGNYQYSTSLNGTSWSNSSLTLAKNEDVVNADWNAVSGMAQILNKPDIIPISAGTGIDIDLIDGVNVISSTVEPGLISVSHDNTLHGDGTSQSPLGIEYPLIPSGQHYNGSFNQYGVSFLDTESRNYAALNSDELTFRVDNDTQIVDHDKIVQWDNNQVDIQTLSAAIDTISGDVGADIFWVEVSVTSYQQISDAVSDLSNKVIKIHYGTGAEDLYGEYTNYYAGRYYFTLTSLSGRDIYKVSIDENNQWDTAEVRIPASQVNSDWEAVSGVSEILNKPSLVQVSGGTGIEITKVNDTLFISSTGGGGTTYEAGQYISIQNDTISATGLVDQGTYDTSCVKYDDVYSTVQNASGTWSETQVNADWNAVSGVAEILNKPSFSEVSAGQGIEIDEVSGTVVISSTGSITPASGVFFARYGVTSEQEVVDAYSAGNEIIAYDTDPDLGKIFSHMISTNPRFTFKIVSPSYTTLWYLHNGWSSETIYYNPPVSGGIETVRDSTLPSYYYLKAKVDNTTTQINSSGEIVAVGVHSVSTIEIV